MPAQIRDQQLNVNFPFPEALDAFGLFLANQVNRDAAVAYRVGHFADASQRLRAKDGKVFHVEIWSNTAPDFRSTFKASVKHCTKVFIPVVVAFYEDSVDFIHQKSWLILFDSAEEGRDRH